MKAFTRLFEDLDATTSTNEKVEALKKYFSTTDPVDAIWAVMILTSRVKRKSLTSRTLRDLFLAATSYPQWLFEESYHQVGDTAETLSLLLATLGLVSATLGHQDAKPLSVWMEEELPGLIKLKTNEERVERILSWWKNLTTDETFIMHKLMTGGLRVGVSEKLVVRALGEVFGVPTDQVAHRLTGKIDPTPTAFARLISKEAVEKTWSQPYPFCLAYAWNERSEKNFQSNEWCFEWKYDGIRSQVIKREGKLLIWSRGEELISDTFPDLVKILEELPDGTVLDGEVLVIREGKVADFNELQKRLGRKKVSALMLADFPAGFIAYDCLEYNNQDIREKSLRDRREILKDVIIPFLGNRQMRMSQDLRVDDLASLEALRSQSRENEAEGLMIKAWESKYGVGRKVGIWWKHKVEPLTLDAVLLYAQAGTGCRANLHTDYTFALWRGTELVPFAKAYSGLTEKEINELDYWIRRHTKEKFGPVRSVEPQHVFEIGFEGISNSTRHKSGIAVRFPRILRWRKDKKVEDADSLDSAQTLLGLGASGT